MTATMNNGADSRSTDNGDSISALFLNCSLKPSSETSNTQSLVDIVADLFAAQGVPSETVRIADHTVPFGITDDAGDGDEWPEILDKIKAADIVIVATPIWMGLDCSMARLVMERMNGSASRDDETGQPIFYNKVAGCLVTGNEDGAHAAASSILFNMTHLGFAVPPNADCYWVGDAGPGPSFIEADGASSSYVQRCARYVAHNCTQLAQRLSVSSAMGGPLTTNLNEIDSSVEEMSTA